MPFTSNDELPKGVKSLPDDQKTKWRKVFNSAYEETCKDREDRDECASKIAWSQVKKAELTEFSLRIDRASFNKATGEMRWSMVGSDTDEDSFHDNMTMELFNDFLSRIESEELVPEHFRSDFWKGGIPYLSISHYLDLNGKAVPGTVDAVYIDGNRLKSKGRFNDTPLGRACFDAVCKDLYNEKNKDKENKVRVSIAFLDWMHKHKSNGYTFIRETLDDICPECIKELITGKKSGLEYMKGHLIHFALTRVPVNKRTDIEVERSMTTKLEDAASIIGEEEAEKIDELAKSMVGKSEALVIKADEVPTEAFEASEGIAEKAKKDDMEHECAEDDEECMKKKGKKYEKKALYTVEDIVKAAYDKIKAEEQPKVVEVHPLDTVIEQLKSRYDEVVKSDLSVEDKLRDIQEPFNAVAEVVRSLITNVDPVEEKPKDQTSELIKALGEFTSAVNNKLDLITVQLANQRQAPIQAETPGTVPQRRSYQPAPFIPQLQQKSTANTGKGMSIRELVERTT